MAAARSNRRRFLLAVVGVAAVFIGLKGGLAVERQLSLSFTKEMFYTLVTDSEGEMNDEIAERIIGLSPGVNSVAIRRESNTLTLLLVTNAEEVGTLPFTLVFDKMDLYKMAMAREDVKGIKAVMDKIKGRNKYLKRIEYRYTERYSIIDLMINADAYRNDKQVEEAMRIEMARKTQPPAPPPPPPEVPKRTEETKPIEEVKPPEKVTRRKPQPPPEPPPPPPPPEPDSLAVRKVSQEAVVDGRLDESFWNSIVPLKIEVKNGRVTLTVYAAAVHDGKNIFLALWWNDPSRDDRHKPWKWNKTKNEYESTARLEDAVAVQFSDRDVPACMTAGKEYEADIWVWRAGRTDGSGFAEDGHVEVSTRKLPQANYYLSSQGSNVWIKVYRDEGTAPYRSEIVVSKGPDEVPRYLTQQPDKSMADVRARGTWDKNRWTVEFARKLSTGHKDDVIFSLGRKTYTIAVAVFNSVEGQEHAPSKPAVMMFE